MKKLTSVDLMLVVGGGTCTCTSVEYINCYDPVCETTVTYNNITPEECDAHRSDGNYGANCIYTD